MRLPATWAPTPVAAAPPPPPVVVVQPEPVVDDVLGMLNALQGELDGPARERVGRLARTLAEQRARGPTTPASTSPPSSSSASSSPPQTHSSAFANGRTPTSGMPSTKAGSSSALAAAGGFIRRTLSFGRGVPPVPPTPPAPAVPSPVVTTLRNVYKWFARTFPDLNWALTAYRQQAGDLPRANERREIKQAVLRSGQVLLAIKTSAEVNGITPEQAAHNADRIYETMAANMWLPVVRVVGYLLRKVFRLLYPFGMDVGTSDLQRVREAARKGPILYLPNHKSYLDFLVISYICFRHGLPLPHVVSGENLNIPVVGMVLRYGGAFFIRRTFNSGADPLFRSVFNEYVTQLLIRGRAVECFIEGGRSRTGKVLPPKPGFMRCVLDAVIDRQVGDVFVVPVSLGYDRIVENDSYIKELTGGKKNAERLFAFLKSSTTLLVSTLTSKRNFGKINVGIGEPISLYDYILKNAPAATQTSTTTTAAAAAADGGALTGHGAEGAGSSSLVSHHQRGLLLTRVPSAGPTGTAAPKALAKPPAPGPATAPAAATAALATTTAAEDAAAAAGALEDPTDVGGGLPPPGALTNGTATAAVGGTADSDTDDGGLALRVPRTRAPPGKDGLAGLFHSEAPTGAHAPPSGMGAAAPLPVHTVHRPSMTLLATTPSPRTPLQFLVAPTSTTAYDTVDAADAADPPPASTAVITAARVTAADATAVCPLPPPSAFTAAARKYLTVTVGYKVMYEINKVSTVLPATLVGTILFTQYGRGIRESDLVKKVQWLRRRVLLQGGRVQFLPEDAVHESIMATVDQVLAGSVKGKLVKRHKDILMLSVYSPAERMELSLYRNQLIHLFVSEGILLCSFYACEMESKENPAWVDKEDLRTSVQFLSQMLKLEFIFKPSPGIDVILDQTVYALVDQGILMRDAGSAAGAGASASASTSASTSASATAQAQARERYCVNDQLGADGEYLGTYSYLFICSLFWPFIDSYLLAALSCYRLLPDRMLDEESLIRWTQTLGETLYFEGMLDLYEAISKDTLQNGLVLLENWGVIQFVSIESDGASAAARPSRRIVQLTAAYREEAAVETLVLKIMRYRKRLRAFRSRRYKSRSNNQNMDVINLVKRTDMNPVRATG
jgi:1-acyl-sn-glycerol-3-phosphate acyltransferase